MFTRQDYLSGKCSHSEYYSQYVTAQTKSIVSFYIPISKIKDAIEAGDTSLNTIPLGKWDALTFLFACNKAMHERGDYATLANKVCILKETAIVLYNEHVNGVS